jgi:hypothetical protein
MEMRVTVLLSVKLSSSITGAVMLTVIIAFIFIDRPLLHAVRDAKLAPFVGSFITQKHGWMWLASSQ